MKEVHLVFGVREDGDDEILNFYGVFEKETDAKKVKLELIKANVRFGERDEEYIIRKELLGKPSNEYYFMTEN